MAENKHSHGPWRQMNDTQFWFGRRMFGNEREERWDTGACEEKPQVVDSRGQKNVILCDWGKWKRGMCPQLVGRDRSVRFEKLSRRPNGDAKLATGCRGLKFRGALLTGDTSLRGHLNPQQLTSPLREEAQIKRRTHSLRRVVPRCQEVKEKRSNNEEPEKLVMSLFLTRWWLHSVFTFWQFVEPYAYDLCSLCMLCFNNSLVLLPSPSLSCYFSWES